jgi:hypothetical protein
VDRAWTDNDQKAIVSALDNLLSSLTTEDDGLSSSQRQWQILHQDLRGDQRLDLLDALVIELVES